MKLSTLLTRLRSHFRVLMTALLLSSAETPSFADNRWPLTVTDALGREVTIAAKPKAILLGSGFNLVALSLIHPDPVSLLAGWSDDMKGDNPAIYNSFVTKFPTLAKVPIIGNGTGDGLSAETILSLKSDLAILANWQADTELGRQAIDYLTATGVPVVVVDFNSDPIASVPRNIRLLGRILERDTQAQAFATFYEEKLARIRSRVASQPEPAPKVLLEAFPNPGRCCYAYGVSGLGEFIELAGGRNIADRNLPPQGGIVNDEFVIAANPEVYIATASPGGKYSGLSVGPGVTADEAQSTLAEAIETPLLKSLDAVRHRRAHGLWNFFNALPINILAAEAFARWIRPDLFADVDPDETLKEINERFAAVPFEGAFWADLPPPAPR